jgi:hypothetical protein
VPEIFRARLPVLNLVIGLKHWNAKMPAKNPPNLTVIDPEPRPNALAPPATLGDSGRALWNAIHADFEITDAAGLAMLTEICIETDRCAEYAEAIARDGAVIRTKNGPKDHPLLKHEIASRSFVVRSLHRLGLDVIVPRAEPGRPAGDYRGRS